MSEQSKTCDDHLNADQTPDEPFIKLLEAADQTGNLNYLLEGGFNGVEIVLRQNGQLVRKQIHINKEK